MPQLRWHVPNFCTGEDYDRRAAERITFNSQEEFQAIPDIRARMSRHDFHQWAIAKDTPGEHFLMQIYTDATYYVTGFLTPDHGLDYPEWKAPRR